MIITKKTVNNSIKASGTVLNMRINSHNNALRDKFNLLRVAKQIEVSAYTKAAALVSFQSPWLMTIEIHCNVVARGCSVTLRGIMNNLPGKPFYVCIANLTAKPANIPKVMIVSSAWNAPIFITYTRDDELHILTDESLVPTQSHKVYSHPTINTLFYKLPERSEEQVDGQKAFKESDKISLMDWCEDLSLPDEYFAYCHKLINMLTQFVSM